MRVPGQTEREGDEDEEMKRGVNHTSCSFQVKGVKGVCVCVHIHRSGKRFAFDVPTELKACMLSLVSRGFVLVSHSEKQGASAPFRQTVCPA